MDAREPHDAPRDRALVLLAAALVLLASTRVTLPLVALALAVLALAAPMAGLIAWMSRGEPRPVEEAADADDAGDALPTPRVAEPMPRPIRPPAP